jgi:hypothetical protein
VIQSKRCNHECAYLTATTKQPKDNHNNQNENKKGHSAAGDSTPTRKQQKRDNEHRYGENENRNDENDTHNKKAQERKRKGEQQKKPNK